MQKTWVWLRKSILRLVFTFLIIIGIAFIPSIYEQETRWGRVYDVTVQPSNYIESIDDYFSHLLKGDLGKYDVGAIEYGLITYKNQYRDVSNDVLTYFKKTLEIFLPAIFLGLTFGVLGAYLTLWFKERWRNLTKFFSFFLVAIPDFFVILLLQFAVIMIYKKTGVRIFAVATGGTSKALFLPIFSLSLLPFAFMYRIALNSFEDVMTNRFIQTAYSKGLNRFNILFSHVSKNGLIVALNNLPSIIMPTVSNLFIVEYMFNTHGITAFVFNRYWSTDILIISVFLIWFMVEGVLLISDILLRMITRHRGENYA